MKKCITNIDLHQKALEYLHNLKLQFIRSVQTSPTKLIETAQYPNNEHLVIPTKRQLSGAQLRKLLSKEVPRLSSGKRNTVKRRLINNDISNIICTIGYNNTIDKR